MNDPTHHLETSCEPEPAHGAADARGTKGSAEAASAATDFEAAYASYFDFACRSLQLLGVAPGSLEDAAQDVFGVVLRRLDEFAGNASLKTWIFAIVQGVAANHRRSQRRKQRPLQSFSDEQAAGSDAGPEAQLEASRAAARVQLFCDGLDEGQRAVFVLALIEDVPAKEVAAALGIPLFTVYSRIRNLRARLERFLDENTRET